jgi:hypothetical protein
MIPNPVSHPSDVEMSELRAISADLIVEAACAGYASARFHGVRIAAVRLACGSELPHIDLFVEYDGVAGHRDLLHLPLRDAS